MLLVQKAIIMGEIPGIVLNFSNSVPKVVKLKVRKSETVSDKYFVPSPIPNRVKVIVYERSCRLGKYSFLLIEMYYLLSFVFGTA